MNKDTFLKPQEFIRHEVTINNPTDVVIEEYWMLRGIIDLGISKKVAVEVNLDHEPTLQEIAEMLQDKTISFVSVEHNFRRDPDEDFPFS